MWLTLASLTYLDRKLDKSPRGRELSRAVSRHNIKPWADASGLWLIKTKKDGVQALIP